MKKTVILVVLVMVLAFSVQLVFAGGGTGVNERRAFRQSFDAVYQINLPTTVTDAAITAKVEETPWACGDDPNQLAWYKWTLYKYSVPVRELTKWNVSKVGLSGIGDDSGEVENLAGYMTFNVAKKTVNIGFASQECQTQFTQEWDANTQKWVCTIDKEYTCSDVNYSLQGELILTIEPYLQIR